MTIHKEGLKECTKRVMTRQEGLIPSDNAELTKEPVNKIYKSLLLKLMKVNS